MNKKQAKALPKYAPNPLFKGLSAYVKNPINYDTIQMALINTLSCGKMHSDVIKMAECSKCTSNMEKRRDLMKKYGFVSPAQYLAWKKIHETIKERVPLDKYNAMKV